MEKIGSQLYYNAEEKFFINLKKKLGKNLLFYCATGSIARRDVIPGWSDIDVLIVCKVWNKTVFKALNQSLALNKSGIKIGTTLYSLSEFNAYVFQDPKTFIAIENILDGKYLPRIHDKLVVLKKMDKILAKSISIVGFAKTLHLFKRELLLYPSFNERSAYKLLTIMLRVLLLQKKIVTDGYESVWSIAKIYLPKFKIPQILPQDIINNRKGHFKRFGYYMEFLSWLEKELC